jgi:probable DNA metabolism protein
LTRKQIVLTPGADLGGFRRAVRRLIAEQIAPDDVVWCDEAAQSLFGGIESPTVAAPAVSLPRDVAQLVECVVCHHDFARYALLYDLIWRVLAGDRTFLERQNDPMVHRLEMMRKSVRRDIHKMHAFVRFRCLPGNRFAAWFEPDHFIVEAAADFFVSRFRTLDWSIITPVGSMHWDRVTLTFGPAGRRSDVPETDDLDGDWQTYYENIYNPARINPKAMRREMPMKYWHNMPETRSIPQMIQTAASRVSDMIAGKPAPTIKRNPEKAVAAMSDQNPTNLAELNLIISKSEPLVPGATQAVLGEGPAHAHVIFVGEQPGDQEDVQGRPFVGPAGQLLRRAINEAGMNDSDMYFTNAVKHFKFVQRGKRRIHQTPTVGEVKHYRWWLLKEVALIKPGLVVALGATASRALTGKAVSVTRERGVTEFDGYPGYITVHPSYLLRIPDEHARQQAYRDFVDDMAAIRRLAA